MADSDEIWAPLAEEPLNKDTKRRAEIIGIEDDGAFHHFTGLTTERLRMLVDEGFADTDDRQNDAPSLGELLDFGESHPGTTFDGYAVEASRWDYRVSIDALVVTFKTQQDTLDFANLAHHADEFNVNANGGNAWWD